jgi:hypothetical protein
MNKEDDRKEKSKEGSGKRKNFFHDSSVKDYKGNGETAGSF